MALVATCEIASLGGLGSNDERMLTRLDEWEIYPRIVAATGLQT
jgi:hypothetical protein